MATETHDPALGDVHRFQQSLGRVERDARKLPWASERQWKTDTHLWAEDGVPVVDLHDLSVSLGRKVTERVIKMTISAGAVVFITGQGRNSIGPAQMKGAVASILSDAVASNAGWSFRPDGPGRFVLITDPERAPRVAQTSLPIGFGMLIAALASALLFAILNNIFRWF
jgi:hypothetical protein